MDAMDDMDAAAPPRSRAWSQGFPTMWGPDATRQRGRVSTIHFLTCVGCRPAVE